MVGTYLTASFQEQCLPNFPRSAILEKITILMQPQPHTSCTHTYKHNAETLQNLIILYEITAKRG